jgi:cardiolipin synthase
MCAFFCPRIPITCSSFSRASPFLPEMEKAGVQVWRYNAGFLHEKAILVDDYCGIGTANFDNRSFRLNFEITLLFAEPATVREVEAMFATDFGRSTPRRPRISPRAPGGSASPRARRGLMAPIQ